MTREEKIEALAEKYEWDHAEELGDKASFIAGAIAGIKLRDEELLAMEFDSLKAHFACGNMFTASFQEGARWQHSEFLKLLGKNES